MDMELFSTLEKRLESLLDGYAVLKRENLLLNEENRRLLEEREGFKTRIDAILKKLEGI